VLGRVGVQGAAGPVRRAVELELIAYLCFHPEGATNDVWATALWPDRVMSSTTLYAAVTGARRVLGQSSDGRSRLARSSWGRIQLDDDVGTDWDRFRSLAASEDPAVWEGALELVRGRPFEGLRHADWATFEGITAEIQTAVADVAARVIRVRRARRDPAGAAAAARSGLLASPFDDELRRFAEAPAALRRLPLREAPGGGGTLPPHPGSLALIRSLSRLADDAEGVPIRPATRW
jgi:hypothetical protein